MASCESTLGLGAGATCLQLKQRPAAAGFFDLSSKLASVFVTILTLVCYVWLVVCGWPLCMGFVVRMGCTHVDV